MTRNPCNGCTERISKCHCSCIKYSIFARAKEEQRNQKDLERTINSYMVEHRNIHQTTTRLPKKF